MAHQSRALGSLTLQVAPGAEPVSLADAKDHMRVDIPTDDTLITGLVLAAKSKIEELTGRKFITQTWLWTFDEFLDSDTLLLPLAPVSSVTSLVTTDEDGATTVFDLATNTVVDTKSEPARIELKSGAQWPPSNDNLQEIAGIALTFIVGYGAAGTDVPEPLKLAIKILTAHYYENREALAPIALQQIPMSVSAIIEPFRTWNRFGQASK